MCKLYQPQGLEKIPEINKRRAFNKAIGPGKNAKLITVGPTSIPDFRVLVFWFMWASSAKINMLFIGIAKPSPEQIHETLATY